MKKHHWHVFQHEKLFEKQPLPLPHIRTTALAEDCVVAKMAKLVEEAQNSKSKTQRFIDKFAQYYTPITHPVL